MTLGEKILKLRKEKDWKRNDLARKISKTQERKDLNITNRYIYRVEKNEIKNPGIYNIKKIANALDVKIDDLLQ